MGAEGLPDPPRASVSSSALNRRPRSDTWAPSAAKRRAIARLIPDPAPVTTTCRPGREPLRRRSTDQEAEAPAGACAWFSSRSASIAAMQPDFAAVMAWR